MRTCLYLNASGEPLNMMPMKDALRLVVQNKVDVVESDAGYLIHTEKSTLPLPVVVRLKRHVYVPKRFVRSVSNTFLFARDGYKCQYCNRSQEKLRKREALTRDHIQPLSKGGKNTWTNCVTACSRCNSLKADKTLKESGMTLRSTPREPTFVELKWVVRRMTPIQRKYVTTFYGAAVARSLGWDRAE